jgi:hypothetical protein
VPLRPPSAQEAAALLGLRDAYPGTAVTDLSDAWVSLGTSYYLLAPTGPPGTKPVEGWEATAGGRRYAMYSASWERYYLVHRLPRRGLEAALGRRLSAADVQPRVFDGFRVSFRSDRLWWYAMIEVVILTGLLTWLAACARHVRHPLLVPPVLLVTEALLLMVVWLYAPTLHDADSFYQRILLDQLADFGLVLLWLGNPLVVLGVSLGLYGIDRLGGWLEARGRLAWRTWRRVAAAIAIAALGALLLADYMGYRRERESTAARIAEASRALPADRLSALRHWATAAGSRLPSHESLYLQASVEPWLIRELDAVLGAVQLQPEERVTVIVPGAPYDLYLTAGRGGAWRHAEIRASAPLSAWPLGAKAMAAGEFSRGYLTHPCWSHAASRLLRTRGDVGALIELEYSREYRPSLLRRLCRAVWLGE